MDIVIVGAGIMSVTLATIVKEITPEINITIVERLPSAAAGNTQVFSNAGTGHEANCEFNYTPVDKKVVNTVKATKIHSQFNVSKQFWAYLIRKGIIADPKSFLQCVKHVTIVGKDDIEELKRRYDEMSKHHFFEDMVFSEDYETIKAWIPLVMDGRNEDCRMAATKVDLGTDINFEALTLQMLDYLVRKHNIKIHYNVHVDSLKPTGSKAWTVYGRQSGKRVLFEADKVFCGAGGGAFRLLKSAAVPEGRKYTGFPVGGRFLMTEVSEDIAKQYSVKAYGKAKIGAPPMSVPHLDIRHVGDKFYLLFGPFATFSPRLEKGRGFFDYLASIRLSHIGSMLKVAKNNFGLIRYLISQSLKGKSAMLDELKDYAPAAIQQLKWQVLNAGQRVQIIKSGNLKMGTEMIYSEDKKFSALLGASPGASTSPEIMLRWVEKVLPELIQQPKTAKVLNDIFPVRDLQLLIHDKIVYKETRDIVNTTLGVQR